MQALAENERLSFTSPPTFMLAMGASPCAELFEGSPSCGKPHWSTKTEPEKMSPSIAGATAGARSAPTTTSAATATAARRRRRGPRDPLVIRRSVRDPRLDRRDVRRGERTVGRHDLARAARRRHVPAELEEEVALRGRRGGDVRHRRLPGLDADHRRVPLPRVEDGRGRARRVAGGGGAARDEEVLLDRREGSACGRLGG